MSKSNLQREEYYKLLSLDLSSCVPACEVKQLDPTLVNRLVMIQRVVGFSLVFTSAFRSVEWDKSKGRDGKSSHCSGLAVDVSCPDSHVRYKLLMAALQVGFPRIGIGKNFLHLDIDVRKPNPLIFHYYG